MARSVKAAVIGAGVAGLIAARELQREGHLVTVFEKAPQLGGTWVYDPRVESDTLGIDPKREIVHSSLYRSLRTNLPRHIMGFSDYPFSVRENGDPRNFPGHEEVLAFLNDFARDMGITELIRFNTEVVRVERVGLRKDEWVIESRTGDDQLGSSEEIFEAVVICNGHHTIPKLAHPPGLERWPGKQVHSHNYRVPEPFRNQVVVMIGNGPSALDISRDIASVAKDVHLSSRSPDVKVSKSIDCDNIWQHSEIEYVDKEGVVVFRDGASIHPNVIFHCTGYKYDFPFLKTNGIVTVDENCIGPLYKHVFPPELGPWLSFVGLPYRSLLFLMMELQSKWIAQALSVKVALPSQEEMLKDVEKHYSRMEERGIPKHHTHRLHWNETEYTDWLAAAVGVPPVEEKLKEIYRQILVSWNSMGSRYRDEWDVDEWISKWVS